MPIARLAQRFKSLSESLSTSLSTSPLPVDRERVGLLATGIVVAEGARCVQCGICSHNCPAGIDVRSMARDGRAIADRRCLLCGSCVARCPRGTLSFQHLEPSDR